MRGTYHALTRGSTVRIGGGYQEVGSSLAIRGLVTATRKNQRFRNLNMDYPYPISMKYCFALPAGPKYAILPSWMTQTLSKWS